MNQCDHCHRQSRRSKDLRNFDVAAVVVVVVDYSVVDVDVVS